MQLELDYEDVVSDPLLISGGITVVIYFIYESVFFLFLCLQYFYFVMQGKWQEDKCNQ